MWLWRTWALRRILCFFLSINAEQKPDLCWIMGGSRDTGVDNSELLDDVGRIFHCCNVFLLIVILAFVRWKGHGSTREILFDQLANR